MHQLVVRRQARRLLEQADRVVEAILLEVLRREVVAGLELRRRSLHRLLQRAIACVLSPRSSCTVPRLLSAAG